MAAKIGVNLSWLIPGQVGGSEEHILRLLRAANDAGSTDLKIKLYCSKLLLEKHSDLADRFENHTYRFSGNLRPARIMQENLWLASQSRNDDLVHHAGGVVPFIRSAVPLVTIHDLQPIEMPENFSKVKRAWINYNLPKSVEAARLILCPSKFTSERIQKHYKTSPERIRVVSHGLDPSDLDDELSENFEPKKLFGNYLLYPAITYPHKHHSDLLEVLKLLETEIPDLNLVFTGSAGPLTDELEQQSIALGLQDRVHQLGRIDRGKLNALFKSALALVFPSAYEGFGNPIVEAMSLECPVITSNAGALGEVADNAAIMFEPGDVETLSLRIAKLNSNPGLRGELIEKGLQRSSEFDWLASGNSLLNAYRDALVLSGSTEAR